MSWDTNIFRVFVASGVNHLSSGMGGDATIWVCVSGRSSKLSCMRHVMLRRGDIIIAEVPRQTAQTVSSPECTRTQYAASVCYSGARNCSRAWHMPRFRWLGVTVCGRACATVTQRAFATAERAFVTTDAHGQRHIPASRARKCPRVCHSRPWGHSLHRVYVTTVVSRCVCRMLGDTANTEREIHGAQVMFRARVAGIHGDAQLVYQCTTLF